MKVGTLGRTMAAAVLGLCVIGASGPSRPALAQTGDKQLDQSKLDHSKMQKRDLIIFQNGNKVEGVVLDETETTVRVLVIIGSLRSEATYNKSEILEIKRDEFKPSEKSDGETRAGSTTDTGPVKQKKDDGASYANPVDVNGKPIPPGTMKVYVCTLGGEFGRDVSKTPVKEMMEDLVKAQPDVVVFRFDHTFGYQGEQTVDFDHQGSDGYVSQLLIRAMEIDTLITPVLRNDPRLVKKPEVVAWVHRAMGGAAFLPLVFQDIYFTSDGHQGGVGGLDFLFDGVGDEVVRQKQRSLRLAWVEGMANQGEFGNDASSMTAEALSNAKRRKYAKAMCWGDYVLSYRLVGGQAELKEEMPSSPEWFILKDDGPTNKDHADSMQDMVRMRGNDYLTFDAKTAFDVGYSKGTADSLEELMNKMGHPRGWASMRTKSGQIFREWSKDVSKTEIEVGKLIRAYQGVAVKPPGMYEQRTEARGRQIRYLQQISSIVKEYAEALNPRRVGAPEGLLDQIDVQIDRIKTQQTLDRRP